MEFLADASRFDVLIEQFKLLKQFSNWYYLIACFEYITGRFMGYIPVYSRLYCIVKCAHTSTGVSSVIFWYYYEDLTQKEKVEYYKNW